MTHIAPLLPGLNIVLVTPSFRLRNLLIRAIDVASEGGIKPSQKSDSVSANRAHYPPAISQVIINTASAEMHKLLGNHSVAAAVIVAGDRKAAGERMAKVFTDAGYTATVHTQAEPEFPDGFLIFVSVPALDGITLMIWPDRAAVPPDLIKELPARAPWTEEDLNSEA